MLLTGSHEQMMALASDRRLDDWCGANIKWLQDTFGEDNLVSCVLHMDEKTPISMRLGACYRLRASVESARASRSIRRKIRHRDYAPMS